MDNKQYLGDGVYAYFNGFSIILTTEDGISVSNTIVMEPEVLDSLDRFRDYIKRYGKK